MDKNTKTVFSLTAVRFAPFLAAGLCAVYFTGCVFLVIPAAVLLAAALLFCRKAAVSAAGLFAGSLIMSVFVTLYVSPVLQWGGQTVHSRLVIAEVTEETEDMQQVVARTEINGVGTSVRLRGEFSAAEGDIVEADVAYRIPAERFRAADISAEIFLYGEAENVVPVTDAGFDIRSVIPQTRSRFIARVDSALCGDERAVVLSMMFGDGSALSAGMREALCVSGVTHYTAVSGTHLSIITAAMIELFLDRKRRASAVISALMVPIGIIFFNGSLSVMRAGVMLMIYYSAPVLGRKAEGLNTLCAAAAAIMIVSPTAAADAGFAMSVLGVFGVAVVSPRISRQALRRIKPGRAVTKKIAEALMASFCATVCTAPVSIGVFGGISLAGVFTSALLMPFMTAGMTLVFVGCISGLQFVTAAAYPFVKVLAAVPAFVGKARGLWVAMDFKGAVYIAVLAAVMLAAAAFFWEDYGALCGRMFALLTAFSLVMPLYSRAQRYEIVFDCGSGSAVAAVCAGNEAFVLISGSGTNIARTAADCLRRNGITHIRSISAPDADLRGVVSISELGMMFGAETVITSASMQEETARELPSADVRTGAGGIAVSGLTIASAMINTPCDADIALYYGRAERITESGSGTAVYFFTPADELPENGVNIYDEGGCRIALGKFDTITLK